MGLIHHSDRGSQYLSMRYTERFAAAYDNALAESVIGLCTTEVIRPAGPWRTRDDVEFATLEWVAWSNTCRLPEPLGYRPPAEYESHFAALEIAPVAVGALH